MGTPRIRAVEDDLFLIEGVLSELDVDLDRQALLDRIGARSRSARATAEPGDSLGEVLAQSADAVAGAMGDHEDTQKFACTIGGRVVCGAFGGAGFLKVGHPVKAVVTRRADVLEAGAILDARQGYLWIRDPCGARATVTSGRKLALFVYLLSIALFALTQLAFPDSRLTMDQSLLMLVGAAVLVLVVTFEIAPDDHEVLDGSTQMFRLLGFADAMGIDLNGYRLSMMGDGLGGSSLYLGVHETNDVFCYQRAIEGGKMAMAKP